MQALLRVAMQGTAQRNRPWLQRPGSAHQAAGAQTGRTGPGTAAGALSVTWGGRTHSLPSLHFLMAPVLGTSVGQRIWAHQIWASGSRTRIMLPCRARQRIL